MYDTIIFDLDDTLTDDCDDTCWCNYNNELKSTIYVPKYEIHKLEELKQIL